MKNIMNIVKKELKRVFQDKRMLFSTIILPGLMLFCIYNLMGMVTKITEDNHKEKESLIYVSNATDDFINILSVKENNVKIINYTDNNLNNIKDEIFNGNIDVYIEFYINESNKETVNVYYNNSISESNLAYQKAQTSLILYNQFLQIKNNIDPNIIEINPPIIIAEESKAVAQLISSIVPMLVVIFIFASALGVAAESVAGEKERNTIATLLVTPITRTQFVLGKTLACLIITILASISSFIGLVGSLPSLMQGMGELDFSISYSIIDFIGMFVFMILIALYGVSMIISTSVYAKNIKEASSLAMPIYFIGIFVPIIAGMIDTSVLGIQFYFIPFYNALLCLKGVMSLDITLIQSVVTLGSSIVYISLIIYALTWLIKKERVLFDK